MLDFIEFIIWLINALTFGKLVSDPKKKEEYRSYGQGVYVFIICIIFVIFMIIMLKK